jgi:HAE1 family hydrophobic/amphiphilic exporter-1
VNPADFPVLFVVLRSATLPLSTVHEYGDITIGQTLSQIPVSPSRIYSAQKFAIRVQADPQAAAARGCRSRTFAPRSRQLLDPGRNAERTEAGCRASGLGQMDKAADYHQIVVAWRNGLPVKLDEVADLDSVENDKIASWLNIERSSCQHSEAAGCQHRRGGRFLAV